MNIGDVARLVRLPAKTIRYYEDIGLVRPDRDSNGYRTFRERERHKLSFLGRARSLGFSIEDCRSLLDLYEDSGRSSADVKRVTEQQLMRIERKLSGLNELRQTLSYLVRECAGDHRPDCPILFDLANAPEETRN